MENIKEIYNDIKKLQESSFGEYQKCMKKFAKYIEQNFAEKLLEEETIDEIQDINQQNLTIADREVLCLNCNLPASDTCELCNGLSGFSMGG